MNICSIELKILLRNKGFLVQMLAFLLLGVSAIFLGVNHYQQQLKDINEQNAYYQSDLKKLSQDPKSTPGSLGYYLYTPAVKTPSPWSALFHGESHEQSNMLRIRLLALTGQIHAKPLNNEEHLRMGWLNLGFVWVYLLPILIGVTTVTRLAEDKATGRWQFMSFQIRHFAKHILLRNSMSFVVIFALNIVLLLVSAFMLQLPVVSILWVGALLLCYQTFWFLLANVIGIKIIKPQLAILGFVIAWIVFCFVLPSMRYLTHINAEHVENGIASLVTQRQVMNESWDQDRQKNLDVFLAQNPQYQKTEALGQAFDWKWYYAMQSLSDMAAKSYDDAYKTDVVNANQSVLFQVLSPALNMEQLLNRLADTDRQSEIQFKEQVQQWHHALQDYWYPYLFLNKHYSADAIKNAPHFTYQNVEQKQYSALFWMVLLSLVLAVFLVKRPT